MKMENNFRQKRFVEKVVIVNGGGGDIGRAVSNTFSREGASVAVVDNNKKMGKRSVEELVSLGLEAIFIFADTSDEDQTKHYVNETIKYYGRIDYLHNNVGILGPIKDLVNYPISEFDRVIKVNLRSIFLGIKYVIPIMRSNGGGSIVNTSSVAATLGAPGICAYAASKAAINAITRTAALEYAKDNIRINSICPAPIDTSMTREVEKGLSPNNPNEARENSLKNLPIGRLGTPEEIANLVAFLCSDESNFITGASYNIDGGMTIS